MQWLTGVISFLKMGMSTETVIVPPNATTDRFEGVPCKYRGRYQPLSTNLHTV